ncbi:MAG: FtsQ-type POTRA domain-containing protein [Acidobacteria bacterium]|nr:FtsQ-type POTRA domain-containing protein [Acidobacteriota bacterium]MBI3657804.1 FtsQ-type POTRA domain-containing protein [Acidobacteriota bacterium]
MEVKPGARTLRESAWLERALEADAPLKRSNSRSIRQTRQFAGPATRLLIACLKLLLLAAGVFFFWKIFNHAYVSDRFEITDISIAGNHFMESSALGAIIRNEFPGAVLRVDLKRLQTRLETETWIQRAEIRRVLPGRLIVQVVERVPRAVGMVGGVLTLVDREGRLLGKYGPSYGKFDLPILKGLLAPDQGNYLAENKPRAALFFNIVEALDSAEVKHSKNISEIDVSRLDDPVFLPMNDPVVVHLGDKDFLQRYMNFSAHMNEYLKLKETHGRIEAVDLRFEDQVVFVPAQTP